MPDNDRPSRSGLETGLRLGCGGLLGLLLVLPCMFGLAEGDGWKLALVFGVSVASCAWLAWRYGDRFWRRAAELFTYFPWWP